MNMTPQQENAVHYRGSTLLVSAGAGSGKTFTLSQRILSRIADPEDPAEIDRFLIVTFTNASAKDLSEKIERVLSDCAARDLSNAKALRQLTRLKYANISTISSFCIGVVKKHFEMLNLPAKLRVCDPAEGEMLRRRVLEGILEDCYAKDDPVFHRTAELFSGSRSDESFFNVLMQLHTKVYSYPDPEKWMEQALDKYRENTSADDFFDTFYGRIARQDAIKTVRKSAEELRQAGQEYGNTAALAKYTGACFEEAEQFDRLANVLETQDYAACCREMALVSKPTVRAVVTGTAAEERDRLKARRDRAYDAFKAIRTLYFGGNALRLQQTAEDCLDMTETLFCLVRELERRFTEEKRSRGLIDFADAEKLTYRLFVERYDSENDRVVPSETAKKYRDSFLEIYIDEYQDINLLQDLIFRSICRYDEKGHECNRFMVGDLKQSIYRFRGACPDLFSGYLRRFMPLAEPDGEGKERREYLSHNFRCSENVVRFTNRVFSHVMKNEYREEDALVYARQEQNKVRNPCEILICETGEEKEEDRVYSDEIKIVAAKIRDVVNNPAYLSSSGKPFTFGDVAVLLRATKNVADRYAKYFEHCGIPTRSEVTEDFFANREIQLCLCLLNAIDNPLRDVYLAGVMRSEIFCFSDDELLSLRRLSPEITDTEGSLWQSVKAMAEQGQGALADKCRILRDKLLRYKKASVGMPSDQLLMYLYAETKLVNVVSEKSFNRYSESGSLRRENLMLLYHLARNFEKQSFRGLSAFLDFLNDRAEKPGSLKSASLSSESDAVTVMSIHHSKGLEFPVCILAGLGGQFNREDDRAKLLISDSCGVGFKLRDLPGMRSANSVTGTVSYIHPFRSALLSEERKSVLEEEKRVLYVGMTRARDLLIMTSKMPKDAFLNRLAEGTFDPQEAGSPIQWILYAASRSELLSPLLADRTPWNPVEGAGGEAVLSVVTPKDMPFSAAEETLPSHPERVEEFRRRLSERMKGSYSYSAAVNALSKISVSDLKKGRLSPDSPEPLQPDPDELALPAFLTEPEEMSPEAKGTALHAFMEHADFKRCEESVQKEAKRLLEEGFLDGEQYGVLDISRLEAFFCGKLYARMKESTELFREKAFTLAVPLEEVYDVSSHESHRETILLQGKIDCFFRERNGCFTVVDFKTDRVKTLSELGERYGIQLKYYRQAVRVMTGSSAVNAVIYSFYHGDFLEISEEV